MAADRIRVFIAGNIYVKRALVRRFLEDDGYEVVGEARNREDMVAAVRRDQPDAVVIDDELLADGPGGGTMGRLRRAAPDARVVVFTNAPTDAAATPEGADGYLEKGLGLASLTAKLGRLFAPFDDEVDREPVGVGAVAPGSDLALAHDGSFGDASSDAPLATASRGRGPGGTRGATGRIAAVGLGAVMVVWGLVAMIASGGDEPAVRAVDRTDTTGGGVVASPTAAAQTPLDQAYATLDDLVGALRQGNYVLATVDARTLMDQRESAHVAGFALTGLDAEVAARLDQLVGGLPSRVDATMSEILGELYPTPTAPADEPGGGSGTILDPVVSATTPPTGTTSGSNGGGSTDGSTGGTTGGSTGGGGGTTGGGGGQPAPLGPGDGRAWGQSHHPDGGWHGEHPSGPAPHDRTQGGKPPWAGGPH
jgi:ActR/RegA family two-component response regulator